MDGGVVLAVIAYDDTAASHHHATAPLGLQSGRVDQPLEVKQLGSTFSIHYQLGEAVPQFQFEGLTTPDFLAHPKWY